jgi:hypothetical protein
MALMYQLNGSDLKVTFVDGDLQGKKSLIVEDTTLGGAVQSFSGDQITATETAYGSAVTVPLNVTVDSGGRFFTLFIPKFGGPFRARSISTAGLVTTKRGPVEVPALETTNYRGLELAGTVSTIDT